MRNVFWGTQFTRRITRTPAGISQRFSYRKPWTRLRFAAIAQNPRFPALKISASAAIRLIKAQYLRNGRCSITSHWVVLSVVDALLPRHLRIVFAPRLPSFFCESSSVNVSQVHNGNEFLFVFFILKKCGIFDLVPRLTKTVGVDSEKCKICFLWHSVIHANVAHYN